jgi:hypothetical protein
MQKLVNCFSIPACIYIAINGMLLVLGIFLYRYTQLLPLEPIGTEFYPGKGQLDTAQTLKFRTQVEHLGLFMGLVMPISGFMAMLATPRIFKLNRVTSQHNLEEKHRSQLLAWWMGYLLSLSAIMMLMLAFNRIPLLIYERS